MKSNVRRNFSIIICVFSLALYYVLPTCFYYMRPLQKPIDHKEATHIIKQFVKQSSKACREVRTRISAVLSSLNIKAKIEPHAKTQGVFDVHFRNIEDAQVFIANLAHGEPSVPIKSAKLYVLGHDSRVDTAVVQVSGAQVAPVEEKDFYFVSYAHDNQAVSQAVLSEVREVFEELPLECSCDYPSSWETVSNEQVLHYVGRLSSGFQIFPEKNFSSFVRMMFLSDKDVLAFLHRLEKLSLSENSKLSSEKLEELTSLHRKLRKVHQKSRVSERLCVEENVLHCDRSSLFFSSVTFLPKTKSVRFSLHPELLEKRATLSPELRLDLDGWLATEKQRISQKLNRKLEECPEGFSCEFIDKEACGKIVLMQEKVTQNLVAHLTTLVKNRPSPISCDFSPECFPIYSRPPTQEDALGCFIFSPKEDCQHFYRGAIYVVFKGLRTVLAKYQESFGEERQAFEYDLQKLYQCFSHMESSSWAIGEDQVLEIRHPLKFHVDVWGEDFVFSQEGNACLEVSTIKDRLERLNVIEKNRQNELVQWHELYRQASCSMNPQERLRAPIPHQSALVENLKLNFRKYARGENALRLGVDFIGGKQLMLSFKDHQGKPLSDKENILKVSDELYSRLNKLGVSEVEIRREGDYIYLSVPGSAKVSPAEILGTSKMSFHVVNEKFSPYNTFRYEVQRFLDYLWFSAQSQGQLSSEFINALASQVFYGSQETLPPSVREAIGKLKQEGLAFSLEESAPSSSELDTQLSMIAIQRDVESKVNPLMIVFRNYALDGASLKDIRPEFSPGEGYILSFSVKDRGVSQSSNSSPTESFYAWTSAFCQDGVSGSPRSQYSGNRGWRMAVVLDGQVISSPVLNAPLREHASVSGNFTHREVSRLAADLKSGVISFVPEVLSEETISSELGKQQGVQGAFSACLALAVLIILMSVYYKFGGVIASGAVILNMLLIWAALQYLDAPLTLSGLAGIILAMGMAVDANVLVFERIREEFLLSRSLALSIETGYKKAFGAIFDSNLTTVLASVLLLLLDTGPIKGFALTLILGIFSSMFTALFMTKFFFVMWIRKTQETQLHMMNKFIGIRHDFLKECKKLWLVSGSVIVLGGVALGFGAWNSVLGMDFKGGYAFTVQAENHDADLSKIQKQVANKLQLAGVSSRDYRIKVLSSSEKLKVYFSRKALSRANPSFAREEISDPELAVAVGLLSETGVDVSSESLKEIQNFWTKVSGQFSNKMRQQALLGLLGAMGIILLYVSFRFEWRYAFSAVCALMHDLIATCAVLVATHFFLQKIQIDLQAVGALMTVLGYSLNNTLIIFDRIREDRQERLFTPMPELINDALQKTLSRTVMTTATTLSVLLILLFVGGGAVFNFAFIMTIGILLGTLSSLYIAPPLLLFMVRKEKLKQ
ncbi:bifunctional preprotein translocase subunit SecD/SecF [Chlamydia pecorum W73]|uniref:protein translocase subunit SecDF n=1 Tax=Chlamydia pecorum TaxID=85991 RepID=UPI0003AD7FCC|nr:protein translocase subunit SecDF [Chlamydia pecorum]AGW38605.1 bifunctional preprotein translocase subunit SecD/SecF [Chlamydia pecorum W73]